MLIAVLTGNVLREPRTPEAPHLRCVKAAKIHRFADVAVSFSPRFADFKNLDCGEFVAPAFHNRRGAFKQARTLFKRRQAPFSKCRARNFNGAFRFRNSPFRNITNNLFRRAGINRRRQFIGPNFFATNHQRIFFAEAAAHFAQRRAHFVLALFINEIHKRRVLVNIAGRGVKGSAVFTMSILICNRRRRCSGGR